ncbi:GHKL domain-containing protein [Bacillus luteolus]|uniref:histidine kinase n=1 Tax=Litchfieldia luteola TaxID=682179 RepID=A0ABR9QKI7_9BACI|nr:HAMP domain-containing sensor histidine kinase [Cytobacillus luteolus]MBE4909015.1 GHKL domain-containing protein [Cytobacillus luteolus]MBP1941874.1 signal transduction histidine kinase [Cytobacillus luteolus]
MGTKWKSRIIILFFAFLLTFGTTGVLTFFAVGSTYFNKDYFHTHSFQTEYTNLAWYITMFEFSDFTKEDAKAAIIVTDEDINEHRYRYGDLPEQINNINGQYESRIQEAISSQNQEIADALITERDNKIEDITANFNSDEHVRAKVKKEKEQAVERYFKERESYRSDYVRYSQDFLYYFEEKGTENVFTNINLGNDSIESYMSKQDILFKTNFSFLRENLIHNNVHGYEEILENTIPETIGFIEGEIIVPKSTSSRVYQNYENYKMKQSVVIVYIVAGFIALLLGIFIARKAKATESELAWWRTWYSKLPIDSRIVFLLLTTFGTFISIVLYINQFLYFFDYPQTYGFELIICLIAGSFFMALTIIQGKLIAPELKSRKNIEEQWQKGMIYKTWGELKKLVKNIIESLNEAFLNRSTGTQLFVVLGILFGLGLAASMVFVHPVFFLFYLVLLAVIGIPIVMILVRRVGEFNRIYEKTNELAAGKMGPNLDISGSSILTSLAENINVLKQGVKASQNAQAKSERLKTELITNVSHDLRTPLTSIISYAELLKKEGVSDEDRNAYLEIIDRKSKRLKLLIDDLFEVSKMASGNIELHKDNVDLVQLLQQSFAEYDDKIKESTLLFRFNTPEKPINATVDGQKLWRVFDNLIGNIIKYSLENSRVYINIVEKEGQVEISFKNVSKYELSNNINELFERFKRGDESRNTEGSGLGLAIAKSIIDLHEGTLELDIDGDLFKVTIVLNQ